MRLSDVEHGWLDRAVELGRQGWGRVHPNPMVGCVLVRNGRVVGEGRHEEFGGPHAEVVALARAGEQAAGATAFVSLEPCDHEGKTPPCSEALLSAGVARVIYAATDPGAESGGGAVRLHDRGVDVIGPVWNLDRARAENPAFYHAAERAAPWMAVKLALSRDGRIAAGPGRRTRISGEPAQHWVHELRAGFDALLVGSETALVDDPRLSVRGGVSFRVPPARVVFDSDARLSPSARMFTEPGGPIFVVTSAEERDPGVVELEDAGARIVPVARGAAGIEIGAALVALGRLGIRSILCEGGGVLATALLDAGVVERMYLLTSPDEIGEEGVVGFGGALSRSVWCDWRPLGEPLWLGRDRLGVFRRRY